MSTNNSIPPLEERIQARLAAAKSMTPTSHNTAPAKISSNQGTAPPARLLHLWEDRVTNALTGEVLFTISRAPRQPRRIFLRPGIAVTAAATNEQICTISFGKLRASSIRITTLPDRREIKLSNTRRRWAFTPTTMTTTATTTPTTPPPPPPHPKIKSSISSTAQPRWIWQKDRTATSPSVILTDDTEKKKDSSNPFAAHRVLARISVNILSFPSLEGVTAEAWTEIVVTAIGLAQHVRNWCKYGGTLEGSGGVVMIYSYDSGCGGDGGGGGGDGGGGCGGDGGGGGGGGGGDGGS